MYPSLVLSAALIAPAAPVPRDATPNTLGPGVARFVTQGRSHWCCSRHRLHPNETDGHQHVLGR